MVDGVVDAVGEGVAEVLEEVERAFVAGGVAVVADDGEDGTVGAEGGDGDEVTELGAELAGAIAEDDVVDFGGVDVAARVSLVGVGGVGVGGLGDVVAGAGVVRALNDGDVGVVVVGEVADDFAVAATAVVGVAEVVEGVGAAGAVGVGSAVDVDVHAAGQEVKVGLRGVRRGALCGVLRGRGEVGLCAGEGKGGGKREMEEEVWQEGWLSLGWMESNSTYDYEALMDGGRDVVLVDVSCSLLMTIEQRGARRLESKGLNRSTDGSDDRGMGVDWLGGGVRGGDCGG